MGPLFYLVSLFDPVVPVQGANVGKIGLFQLRMLILALMPEWHKSFTVGLVDSLEARWCVFNPRTDGGGRISAPPRRFFVDN